MRDRRDRYTKRDIERDIYKEVYHQTERKSTEMENAWQRERGQQQNSDRKTIETAERH